VFDHNHGDVREAIEDPMLWLPDAVAGAMSASLLGEDR
jgi:hypothetical protein